MGIGRHEPFRTRQCVKASVSQACLRLVDYSEPAISSELASEENSPSLYEAFKKIGNNVNVQLVIEESQLYMLGRSHGDTPTTTY